MRITLSALLGAAAILAGCAGSPVPGAETAGALRAAYVAALTARLGTRAWLPGGGG